MYQPWAKILLISPSSGPFQGGTPITFIGTDFPRLPSCRFGLHDVLGESVTSSKVICVSPDYNVGNVSLEISSGGSDISDSGFVYGYYGDVSIDSLSETAGPAEGGLLMTINGIGFLASGAISCNFAGVTVSGTFISSQSIVCRTPVLRSGLKTVKVSLNGVDYIEYNGRFVCFGDMFVTKVYPLSGPTIGGTIISITGIGFVADANIVCKFALTNFEMDEWDALHIPPTYTTLASYVNQSVLTCLSPINPPYPAFLFILNSATSSYLANTTFVYYPDVVLSLIEPSTGSIFTQTSVTLIGSNFRFSEHLVCRFGKSVVRSQFLSQSASVCLVPPSPEGRVNVEISNNAQDFTTSNISFVFIPCSEIACLTQDKTLFVPVCLRMYGEIVDGGNDWIELAPESSTRDGEYVGYTIFFLQGDGEGQSARVIHYNGSNRIANITLVPYAPSCIYPLASFGATSDSRTGLWVSTFETMWLPDNSSVPGTSLEPTCTKYLLAEFSFCPELAQIQSLQYPSDFVGLPPHWATYQTSVYTNNSIELTPSGDFQQKLGFLFSEKAGSVGTVTARMMSSHGPVQSSPWVAFETVLEDPDENSLTGVLILTDIFPDSLSTRFTVQYRDRLGRSSVKPWPVSWTVRTVDLSADGICFVNSSTGVSLDCNITLEPKWIQNVQARNNSAAVVISLGSKEVCIGFLQIHGSLARPPLVDVGGVVRILPGAVFLGGILWTEILIHLGNHTNSGILEGTIILSYDFTSIAPRRDLLLWGADFASASEAVSTLPGSLSLYFIKDQSSLWPGATAYDGNDVAYKDMFTIAKVGFFVTNYSFPFETFVLGGIMELYDLYGRMIIGGEEGGQSMRIDYVDSTLFPGSGEKVQMIAISKEPAVKSIFAFADDSELLNMPAIAGPDQSRISKVTIIAVREVDAIDVSSYWASGMLTCVSLDPLVLDTAGEGGCDVSVGGDEQRGSQRAILQIIYMHPLFGNFSTQVPFRVWFPYRVKVSSQIYGVGSGSDYGLLTEVVLRPINGWKETVYDAQDVANCLDAQLFQSARVHVVAEFGLESNSNSNNTFLVSDFVTLRDTSEPAILIIGDGIISVAGPIAENVSISTVVTANLFSFDT